MAALSSPIVSGSYNTGVETSVQATLRRSLAAESEYRAVSLDHRFTCESPLLRGFEREHWFADTELGLATDDQLLGPGRYWFRLHCGPLSRGDDLSIEANKGGVEIFTIDASRTIRRGPLQPH